MVYPTEVIDGEDYYYDENDNNILKPLWVPPAPPKNQEEDAIVEIFGNVLGGLSNMFIKSINNR